MSYSVTDGLVAVRALAYTSLAKLLTVFFYIPFVRGRHRTGDRQRTWRVTLLFLNASFVRQIATIKRRYIYLRRRRRLCFLFGLSVGLLANLWTDFDEIFWRGRAWLKDQVIQFGGDPDHASDPGVQSPKSGSSGRNPDPPDRQRFVLSEHSFLV